MDDKKKEGESKAERENSNPVFRGLPFGNKEEGSGPDSVHGLSLPLFSGPDHPDGPILVLSYAL